jgi:hypothetical protein
MCCAGRYRSEHNLTIPSFLLVWIYRWFPSFLGAIAILRPETIIRWHRGGFRSYWRSRSGNRVGRPRISAELRKLIGEMSRANHLWGAPHIHGELLKLGFTLAQSTVARYMYRGPPSQGWRTFLTNHADGIAAIDLFVLPTITFRLLYCLVILRHGRRLWVSFGVTTNPTAEWISRQITDAFPWDSAPRYLVRDRDTAYGPLFVQRLRAMGIRDRPIAPRSPWQNPYVERLIGTIRRECLDHMTAEIMSFKDGETVDDDLRNVIWKGHFLWNQPLADVMMHVPVDRDLARKNGMVTILAPYFSEQLVVARNRNRVPQLVTLDECARLPDTCGDRDRSQFCKLGLARFI